MVLAVTVEGINSNTLTCVEEFPLSTIDEGYPDMFHRARVGLIAVRDDISGLKVTDALEPLPLRALSARAMREF
jgi:hypothetical protein